MRTRNSSFDPLEIFNLFKSFPFENLSAIKWIKPVDYNRIKEDFFIIAEDIVVGSDNSLI